MSNEVAILNQQFTPEQLNLITATVAKGASRDELQLFLYRCKNLGLDPLKPGQIHFVKYGNGPGSIVVGIEGFRAIAHRTGKLAGIKRGALKDEKGNLTGAFAEIYRSDWNQPAREEVPLSEYNTGRGPWQKMPETMIKKVAEAAALRMAFPNDLGGVYTNEEMDQVTTQAESRVAPQQPDAGDGVHDYDDGVYRMPGGQYARKGFHEIGPKALGEYITKAETRFAKKPDLMPEWWGDFVSKAEPWIAQQENGGDQE
jgi:phage recombination protein Bet